MEGEPARQQHDFYRHHRHGAPRYLAVKREQIARKHIAVGGAALRQDPVARTHHVRRIDQVADHLKREIGLYAGTHIRCPGVVQRPASVCRLNATEIARHFCFEGGIDRLAAIMPHQHIFGGNGGVGLKFEDEMAVWPLQREKRLCGGGARILQPEFDVVRGRLRKECLWSRSRHRILLPSSASIFRHIALHTSRVASFPDRIAPSMVAGRPVAVQSPARKRFRQRVHDCGLLAFSFGSAAKVARRSLMMCQGGKTLGKLVSITTSFQTSCASISRGASIHRSAALMVAEIRSRKANSHSAVPFTMPVMVGSVSGGFRLKCTLTMARKVLGAGNSGRSRGATGAGTARITASSGARLITSSPKSSALIASSASTSWRS